MKKSILILSIVLLGIFSFSMSKAQTANQLKAAKGKTVFLVVTEGSTKLAEAKKVASEAQNKVSGSIVVEMDKSDAANADLVKKFGLSGAPLPVILVLAENGAVGGGYILSQATADKLVEAIPTKKQSEVLKAFGNRKAVFIVLSKKGMVGKEAMVEACNKSISEMGGRGRLVDIDLDDKNEASFIQLLKPDVDADKPVVIVFNANGQYTSKYSGSVASTDLSASAIKVIKSSCCAPGSRKSCN